MSLISRCVNLGPADAGGVESHEQDALARSACCMEELCDSSWLRIVGKERVFFG